jgi:hypothetical protein
MKKLIFLSIAVVGLSFYIQAQSRSDKMYEAFSDLEGVTNISFSKNMIDAINLNVGDEGDERKVTGNLRQVRFLSYNPKKGNLHGNEFMKKAIGYLPKSDYKKYEEKDDDFNNGEIWLMGNKKKYQECHLFIKNENSDGLQFVVSFYGDFRVEDIDGLKKAGKGFSDD